MKATIVKDNEFKTVGFLVTANGKNVFQWGIHPHPMVFCKEINVKDWETEIFELVRLAALLRERGMFAQNWFECAIEDSGMNPDLHIKTIHADKRLEQTRTAIENIINNII